MAAERLALDRGSAFAARRSLLEHRPVRLAEAQAEHELADVVQQARGERRAAVAAGALDELLRRGCDHRAVQPHLLAVRCAGTLRSELAPDREPDHDVA